jgi:hypothetical protein
MRARAGGNQESQIEQSRTLRAFADDLGVRLRTGSHLILFGPRGIGKSTLLTLLGAQNRLCGAPCGVAHSTSGLPDVVAALAQAYPATNTEGIGKRAARARLRSAADRRSGVLLLDHATTVTTAMHGYLRRLRGGIAGTLLVADVDTEHERERLRAWRIGALSVRMPVTSDRQLHQRLLMILRESALPALEPRIARLIIRAARGRIGWLMSCINRMHREEYWSGSRLHLAALCTDTEIALRQSRPGPRLRWRP